MSRDGDLFQVGPDEAVRELAGLLERSFTTRRRGPEREESTLFDTFDWRLQQGDAELHRAACSPPTLTLRRRGLVARAEPVLDAPPAFAEDLPAGRLRDELAPLLGVRRLLPRLGRRARVMRYDFLDAEEKTVARLEIAEREVRAENRGPWVRAATLVRLERVRGYDRWYERVLQRVRATPGLRAIPERSLEGLGRLFELPVGQNPSKLDVHLDPESRLEPAAREILRALLATLRRNHEGVLADVDPEFLHDLRVAVRRTRSLLGQLRGVFPPAAEEHYAEEFRWVGQVTGPTRDLDVLLEGLPGYLQRLPEGDREAQAALVRLVSSRRGASQRSLAQELGSERYRRLIENWADFLGSSTENGVHRPLAQQLAVKAAAKRIWKRFRRIAKRGRKLHPSSPAADLHALRIDCKKLRYLLETFRSLFSSDGVSAAVSLLKKLQNSLGDFNDLEVHAQLLTRLADAQREGEEDSRGVLIEVGRLVGWLDTAREEKRLEFFERFRDFDSEATAELYEAHFRHPWKHGSGRSS